MKLMTRNSTMALIASAALTAASAHAADKPSPPKVDPQMAEMMKKAEVAATPGIGHKALEPLAGNWKAEVRTWMAPDAPPTVTKATAKRTWIMGNRFLQEEFKGEFMDKKFRGLAWMGYDNTKQKFNSVWIDDMHTGLFASEGSSDNTGKVITLEGKMDCPATGQKDMVMKQVFRIVGPDKHVFEMHDPSKGTNSRTMEITYTRK